MTLFINAMNVHQGGGRTLLAAIVAALTGADAPTLVLDRRFPVSPEAAQRFAVRRVEPTLWSRALAERWLADQVGPDDILLCFGNLPPLFRSRGTVSLFVQNRLLLDGAPLGGFPLRTRLRLAAERRWFRSRARHADAVLVQTPSMRAAMVTSGLFGATPIHVRPLVPGSLLDRGAVCAGRASRTGALPRCVYVASGEPHKNHRRLVEAWIELAARGPAPPLALTVGDEAPELRAWIEAAIARHRLPITNHGRVAPERARSLLAEADVLVFPSMLESFGLPLIEAREQGLAIVASELDFVRDVAAPTQTFDPCSALSIARAIARFLDAAEPPLELIDARRFLDLLPKRASAG